MGPNAKRIPVRGPRDPCPFRRRDGGNERRLAGCPATSLPAMAFAAEIGVVDLDPAGQTLAGIPLEQDLLQLVFELPGGAGARSRPVSSPRADT